VIDLNLSEFRFTSRVSQIIKNAKNIALQSNDGLLMPLHLFIACIQEKGGAMGELWLKANKDILSFHPLVSGQFTENEFHNLEVTDDVEEVLEVALGYMKRYNQLFLNEGHLLKALITTNKLDNYLSEETRRLILTLGTTSRDMIAHLGSYHFPLVNAKHMRRVVLKDKKKLIEFVKENFSEEWAKTIEGAFIYENPSVYVALNDMEDFIGFAAYDVYQRKKGYFGPMGVVTKKRVNGIGYALLHHCLQDMKEIGYEYAIIGGAGPIEFYEKACNAVVIPSAH
jgi:N-acetylglutamate synthase-like GNAT family acetyltransferase